MHYLGIVKQGLYALESLYSIFVALCTVGKRPAKWGSLARESVMLRWVWICSTITLLVPSIGNSSMLAMFPSLSLAFVFKPLLKTIDVTICQASQSWAESLFFFLSSFFIHFFFTVHTAFISCYSTWALANVSTCNIVLKQCSSYICVFKLSRY